MPTEKQEIKKQATLYLFGPRKDMKQQSRDILEGYRIFKGKDFLIYECEQCPDKKELFLSKHKTFYLCFVLVEGYGLSRIIPVFAVKNKNKKIITFDFDEAIFNLGNVLEKKAKQIKKIFLKRPKFTLSPVLLTSDDLNPQGILLNLTIDGIEGRGEYNKSVKVMDSDLGTRHLCKIFGE